jgi:hypothetical protein
MYILINAANCLYHELHFGLDLVEQSFQLVHVGLLLGPANNQPLLYTRFGDLELVLE